MSLLRSKALKQRESQQKYRYRQMSAELVRQRWERSGSLCEGCGRQADIVEVAHLFSKAGHIIDDKYASTPELCMALCCARTWGDRIGCHERIDRNLDGPLRDRLRWEGIARFAARHQMSTSAKGDPIAVIRRLVDKLEGRE